MIESLGERGRGNGAGDKFQTDRPVGFGRQGRGEPARIKRMTIARKTHEAGYRLVADVVEDLRALEAVAAPIVMRKDAVTGTRPRGAAVLRQIVQIGAYIGRAHRVAPQFPSRTRTAELLQEPGLLSLTEHRLRRFLAAKITQLTAAQGNLQRRLPLAEGRTGIENIEDFFCQHLRKIFGKKVLHLRP